MVHDCHVFGVAAYEDRDTLKMRFYNVKNNRFGEISKIHLRKRHKDADSYTAYRLLFYFYDVARARRKGSDVYL